MTRLLEHLTAGPGERDRTEVDEATDLKFVGPVTAGAIEEAGFAVQDLVDKNVSYRMLLSAGVNAGVAAKIRRYHSLSWSFDADGDLSRRSEQVRGLQDEERAWVADSGIGDADVEDDPAAEPTTETDGEAAWIANSESAQADEEASNDGDWPATDTDGEHATTTEEDDEAAWLADSESAATTADGSGDPIAAEAAWRERSKPTPLTEISGLGDRNSKRLAEAGVTSVRSLATASPELLSDVTGIAEETVQEWHDEASTRAE
ncbi:MAG: helix-hairpin-helix domain-containing protein [Halolamina sp.]|uniref:helix-hairpin-helix domain-containing protein n=1 Tax=Halolamina sp. TaxID=1940283 RepID=UPI002FC2842F